MRLSSTEPTKLSIIDSLEQSNQVAIDVDNNHISRALLDAGFIPQGSNPTRFVFDFNKNDTYDKFYRALEMVFMRCIPSTPQGDISTSGNAPPVKCLV